MKKNFVLQEVIDDLINTDKSLSSPLMKLTYFGLLIKNQELINYTRNELNGYRENNEIPSYRRTPATLYIDIQAGYHTHTVMLPISMIEEQYQESYRYIRIREGIVAIEKLVKENDKENSGHIGTILPMEMLDIFQEPARKIYKTNVRIDVIKAQLSGNPNILIEILNAVRTKLLGFVMSLAYEFGYDIEIESFNQKSNINNQTIIHQMNTTINNSGDGNIINTGNKNNIENNVSLYKGDLNRLQDEFRKQGIDEEDIAEITGIVNQESPDVENNRLGEKSNGWISNIINKSLNGIGKIATGISANLLATLLKEYYGMI